MRDTSYQENVSTAKINHDLHKYSFNYLLKEKCFYLIKIKETEILTEMKKFGRN